MLILEALINPKLDQRNMISNGVGKYAVVR